MTIAHDPQLRRWARLDRRTDKRERNRRRRDGKRGPVSLTTLRISEIYKVFADIYGGTIPDDDAGRLDLEILANHLCGRPADNARNRKTILMAVVAWAPWILPTEAAAIAEGALRDRKKYRADTLAAMLGVTTERRNRLNLRTIGANDTTADERAAWQVEKARQRKERRRRASGATARADYEARSISRAKPWAPLGMSRTTWYRVGKPTVENGR